MKKMKKLFSLVMALAMVMSLTVAANAAEAKGTITLKNPEGVTDAVEYGVYKVFSLNMSADHKNFTYTATTAIKNLIEGASGDYAAVKGYFDFKAILNDTENWTVIPKDTFNEDAAALFSKFLSANVSSLTAAEGSPVTVTGQTPGTINVPYGYYFVDSNVGSLCMLDSTTPDVTITDKNIEPTVKKEQTVPAQVKIGDTIDYTITIGVKDGAKNYTLHDNMGAGLTLNADSIKVKVDGEDVDAANYTKTTTGLTDNCDFEIKFEDSYVAGISGKNIVVTYTATIADVAAIPNGTVTTNTNNKATLSYGDKKEISGTETNVDLYLFDLVKTTKDNKLLDGATFKLYKTQDGNDVVNFKFADGVYKVTGEAVGTAGTTTDIVVTNGKVTVAGLNGTYYLEETVAPAGYNKLSARETVEVNANKIATVNDTDYVEGGVEIENLTGLELPSTGGIGTTIFTVVGGALMVGAAVLFITKKRSED